MHKDHAKDGLVILMVDIDPAVARNPVLKDIVTKVGTMAHQHDLASMTHIVLDESQDVIDDKLRVGTPGSFVFNREGKWRRLSDEGEGYHENLEKLVAKLLSTK